MRHPSTRAAHAHWQSLKDAGHACRERIEPAAIREALRDVFLVDGLRSGEPGFALAGTRVCAILGGEMRGRPFMEPWDDAGSALAALARVREGETCVGECEALSAGGFAYRFEVCLMPLSHRGVPRAAAMGVLAPLGPDAWAGQVLETWRYDAAPARAAEPPARAAEPPAAPSRRPPLLRLLTGGLA